MAEYIFMTSDERVKAAQRIMAVLEKLDTKDGDRERELIGILEIVAKLVLPTSHVKLLIEGI